MQLYTREETIRKINHLGQSCRPFIFIINYLQDASYIEEVASVDPSEVVYNLNGFTNQSSSKDVLSCFEEPVHWNSYPESFDSYRRSFDIVQRNIFAGNSFLTNLTCRTPIETNLSLKDIFFRSKAMYKLWVRDQFTVFSPEIFVRIQQGKISSYPMKGTLDASLPSAVRQLMDDPKEAAEHATIVDLIRNDLSIVAVGYLCPDTGILISCRRIAELFFRRVLKYREPCRIIIGKIWDTFFSNSCLPFYHRCSQEKNRCRLSVKPRRMREDSIRV